MSKQKKELFEKNRGEFQKKLHEFGIFEQSEKINCLYLGKGMLYDESRLCLSLSGLNKKQMMQLVGFLERDKNVENLIFDEHCAPIDNESAAAIAELLRKNKKIKKIKCKN